MPFDENAAFERFASIAKAKEVQLDWPVVERAYKFAALTHRNQRRLSGDPLISHCLAVAEILLDYAPDTTTIEATFLHDVVKDGGVPLEYIERDFGKKVAVIIDGLTKIGRIPFLTLELAEAENIKKMILALSKDIRIILIKLADRLHNMRTIDFLPPTKREQVARETLEIYASIARKLNLTAINNELEDLSFAVLWPEDYKHIVDVLAQRSEEREAETERLRSRIETELKGRGMHVTVHGRTKHLYSIFRKMKKKQLTFEELMDLTALRIITKTVPECYRVLSILTELFPPIPNTLDDYILAPKPNMYQSLHISLLSDRGKPIEVQIRTEEMHEIAEKGIAAHWRYKGFMEEGYEKKLEWMQSLLKWQKEVKEASEYIEGLKVEFFERGIVVFTPKGDMVELPEGSTGVDFAYAIHREIGDHCDRVKVNGKAVPLSQPLKDGDIVEVLTAPQPKINSNWLTFVRTKKARSQIKAALQLAEKKPKARKKMAELEISLPTAVSRQKAKIVEGVLEVAPGMPNIKRAGCCSPVPGQGIVAIELESNGKYSIHAVDCREIGRERKRAIPAQWIETRGAYIQKLNVVGEDKPTLLSDVLKAVMLRKLAIERLNVSTTRDGRVVLAFIIRFHSEKELDETKADLKNIAGVREVYTLT